MDKRKVGAKIRPGSTWSIRSRNTPTAGLKTTSARAPLPIPPSGISRANTGRFRTADGVALTITSCLPTSRPARSVPPSVMSTHSSVPVRLIPVVRTCSSWMDLSSLSKPPSAWRPGMHWVRAAAVKSSLRTHFDDRPETSLEVSPHRAGTTVAVGRAF
jgi:hypothetical protein